MDLFILNAGSSSLKFKVISMPEERLEAAGIVENIGAENGSVELRQQESEVRLEAKVRDHEEALELVLSHLKEGGAGMGSIGGVGHRVVHGGEKYKLAALISEDVVRDIQALCDLAPLHNPANLSGIAACQKFFPSIPNVAVFDTAFHQTLPPKAYLYGLPYELYEKFGIRKYGFHGISHKYVSREAMRLLKENIKDFKVVSAHLGAGASVCAISEGKSVEISMGFTPLEGLMMGTRAGSFDPEIVIFLLKKGFTLVQVEEMMLKKGGLKGISQSSYDVRDLREDELSGEPKSELAFEMFVYRVQRFIGSYSAVLGGLEVLIFTGGVGEKAYYLRRKICEKFGYLGLNLDAKKNRSSETVISSGSSDVTVMVVPTDEELEIARETFALLNRKNP
jgi:acetate kinase